MTTQNFQGFLDISSPANGFNRSVPAGQTLSLPDEAAAYASVKNAIAMGYLTVVSYDAADGSSVTQAELTAHTTDVANPHSTTLEKARTAGPAFAGNVGFAGNQATDAVLVRHREGVFPTDGSFATSGATYALDFSKGNIHQVELGQNCAFSIANWPAAGQEACITLRVKNAGFTVTLPTGVVWTNAVAPTPSTTDGDVEIFTFCSCDHGATIYGFVGMVGGQVPA